MSNNPGYEPPMQHVYDLLSDPADQRGFERGVNIAKEPGEFIERPTSVMEEVTERYEKWAESESPYYLKHVSGQKPAMLLGMFAEVAASRELQSDEELREAELARPSYGGSE